MKMCHLRHKTDKNNEQQHFLLIEQCSPMSQSVQDYN